MHRYTQGLVRRPGPELVRALTTVDRGLPDWALALEQHRRYVAALEAAGVRVEVLEADPAFPDGCFVEDTHLVLPEVLVRLRPAAPSRQGEPAGLEAHLPRDRPRCEIPDGLGIDGGDVLRVGRRLWVGLSRRTSAAAARALAETVEPYGYTVTGVPVPGGLHLKSTVTSLGENLVVVASASADDPAVRAIGPRIELAAGEAVGANLLPVNDHVLVAAGCPGLRDEVARRSPGARVVELDMSELNKVDGMLTCLSLLW